MTAGGLGGAVLVGAGGFACPEIDDAITEGLATVENVQIKFYRGGGK